MKRPLILIAIILWTLVAVAVVAAAVFGINGGFSNMTAPITLTKNEDIMLGNTQNIVIEGSHQAVEVRKTGGGSIKVSQYGSEKTRTERLFLVSSSDDGVRIYFNNDIRLYVFDFSFNEKLVVEIPESFTGNLSVKTSSGGIKTEDELTLTNVELNSSSGGIHINKKITADNLKIENSSGGVHAEGNIEIKEDTIIKCTSGGIRINAVTSEKLDAAANSGNIQLLTANVETYRLHSTSGGISADSISGEGEATSSSGGIRISLKNPKGEIRLNSTSGGIKVVLEPSLQFTLDAQTSSGGIHTTFAAEKNDRGNKATAAIGNNPTVHIFARASSGAIRIEK